MLVQVLTGFIVKYIALAGTILAIFAMGFLLLLLLKKTVAHNIMEALCSFNKIALPLAASKIKRTTFFCFFCFVFRPEICGF